MRKDRTRIAGIALSHVALWWAVIAWFAASDSATVNLTSVTIGAAAGLGWILVILRRSRPAWAFLLAVDLITLLLTVGTLDRAPLWLLPVGSALRLALLLAPATRAWVRPSASGASGGASVVRTAASS